MIVSTNERTSGRITSAKGYKIFVTSDKGCMVTYGDPRVAYSDPKVTHSDP